MSIKRNKIADTRGPDQANNVSFSAEVAPGHKSTNGVVCPPPADTNEQTPGLKKKVGLVGGISLIVGTMIGSGIFVSPAGLAAGSGSVALSLILWTVCGIISTMGALCLAELGTFIPESGGEYVYLKAAFGSVPAYMFSWMSILLLKPASASIISLTCAEYIMVPLYDMSCSPPPVINKKILASVVVLLLTALNSISVKLATRIQIVFTAAKLGAMALIIVGGIVMIAKGHTEHLGTGFLGTRSEVGPIALGIYNGMWAYDGWNNLNYVTEELINPYVNLPRSIMIAIPLVTVLYLMVNVSYYTVMSLADIMASPAVAVTWGMHILPGLRWLIPVAVSLSTFGAANGTMFSGGRLTYVAAREGHMLKIFSFVHVTKNTPMPSLILTCVLAIVYIIPGDIASLIDVFNFAVWLFYGLTMLALIVLRFTRKHEPRPYKVPLFVPVVVMIVSMFLVVAPIVDRPQIEFVYAGVFIISGLILYLPFVHFRKQMPCMTAANTFFQLLMQVTPPVDESAD